MEQFRGIYQWFMEECEYSSKRIPLGASLLRTRAFDSYVAWMGRPEQKGEWLKPTQAEFFALARFIIPGVLAPARSRFDGIFYPHVRLRDRADSAYDLKEQRKRYTQHLSTVGYFLRDEVGGNPKPHLGIMKYLPHAMIYEWFLRWCVEGAANPAALTSIELYCVLRQIGFQVIQDERFGVIWEELKNLLIIDGVPVVASWSVWSVSSGQWPSKPDENKNKGTVVEVGPARAFPPNEADDCGTIQYGASCEDGGEDEGEESPAVDPPSFVSEVIRILPLSKRKQKRVADKIHDAAMRAGALQYEARVDPRLDNQTLRGIVAALEAWGWRVLLHATPPDKLYSYITLTRC